MDMMQLDLFAFAAVQAKKEIETASRMDESIPKIDTKHTPVILWNFQIYEQADAVQNTSNIEEEL